MSIQDYNSTKSQAIKERFVEKEVFGCISTLMERVIRCERKDLFIEREVLGGIVTLMEKIIKNDQKERFVEKEILRGTSTLMETVKGDKECELFEETENLYRYNLVIPDIKNLKVHEKVLSCSGGVLESKREKVIKEIKEKIAELKGEENVSELMLEEEEISDETNKTNQSHMDARIGELQSYLADIENAKREQREIFDWLHISSRLHDKLREKGEPVWNDGQVYAWGRTSTGHAISFDDVISEICADMEILEGQKNEWKV